MRMLKPDTTERFLNTVVRVKGIRRMMIHGPNLPATVPYGPARGNPNPHSDRRIIKVGETDFELRVQAGTFIFEMEDEEAVSELREVCDVFFSEMPYHFKVGKFMKTAPTTSDYARYGPNADETIIGLVDPRRKDGPVIIQGLK